MGEVFEARDLTLGTILALKTIRKELAGSPEAIERLRREVVLARRVTHPNVCRIFEFFEAPEGAFLTMELLDGESLLERVRRIGPLSPDQAVRVLRDVAAGLEAIHAVGIVHRDVKAGNVLLVDDGSRGRRAVVTDFGIALGGPAERLTEAGAVVGTPDAMAPEQRSGEAVSARTDVYALAVLARDTVAPQSGHAGLEGVPSRWREPLRRSLDPDPGRRHASPAELVAALEGRRRSRWLWPVALALVFLLAGGGVLALRRPAPIAADRRSVAVLPLVNLGSEAADGWFSDGLTEDITTQLAHVPGLKVISRTSASGYRNTTKPIRQIASELGVSTVLEGSVRRADGRVRITTQLVDARTDEQLWAETYDRDSRAVLDLQTEVAQKVAAALKLRLGDASAAQLGLGGTRDPEAYESYLRGLHAMDRYDDQDSNKRAAEAFERAVQLDPAYALAHAELGDAYGRLALYENAEADAKMRWFEKARVELARAESLAPGLARVHTARVPLLFSKFGNYDAEGALAALRRAHEIDPRATHVEATVLYDHIGLDDQAIREATAALELDPTSRRAHGELINAYVFNARHRELLARRDELSPAPERLGYLDFALLHDPGGRAELRKVLEKEPLEQEEGPPTRALLLAFDGRRAEAGSALREAARRASPAPNYYHHFTFCLAVGFAMVGQPEEAMRWLRKTAEIGFPNAVAFRKEPGLASLHGRADYEALIADLEKRRARWAAEAP